MRWLSTAALLLLVLALGFGARAVGAQRVFLGDAVVFPVGDAYYHLRRAEFSLEHWPELLRFDPLVNHPDGAWIPWPPLHTALLAGTARALGGSRHALEIAAAWIPPLTGALLALPVFAAGAALAGRRVGLGAAVIAALLPISVSYSDVGNADHHATVAFFGAIWLLGALRAVGPGGSRACAQAIVAAGRLGVLATWAGSLLYLVIADGAVVAVCALRGRRDALPAHALGLTASALATLPLVPALGPTVGGPFSTIALSYLHPAVMAALAGVAAGAALLEWRRPSHGGVQRLARSTALALCGGVALLALPGLLSSAREVAGFVGKHDPWARRNAEQRPLWSSGPGGWLRPLRYYGGFGPLIPLVPLVALYRARRCANRDAWLVFATWSGAFGALALGQLRYGSDFAPAASIGFAAALQTLDRALGGGRRAHAVTAAAALLGTGPMLAQHAAQARYERAGRGAVGAPGDPLLASPAGTLYRFAQEIERVTPDPGGYLDPDARPAYGLLSPANVGHVLHYVARRATPSDNFGPYAGSRHFRGAQAFFRLRSEQRAVRLAERLDVRFVLTLEYGPVDHRSLMQRLHREDGRERDDAPRWEHFRLIAEGPARGQPLAAIYGGIGMPGVAPYKLFERVAGAVLAVRAMPDQQVEAAVTVASPLGRRFEYVARGAADATGTARLRVPYATDAATPVRPVGPWRVRVGDATLPVSVSEADVRQGRTLPVDVARSGPG